MPAKRKATAARQEAATSKATYADWRAWAEKNGIFATSKDRPAVRPAVLKRVLRNIKPAGLNALESRLWDMTRATQKASKATLSLSTHKLTVDGKALTLSRTEGHVLALLVSEQTASITKLREQSGEPHRVLKGLRKKYPALTKYISLPGGSGRGGYSTTIAAVE
jgi:hypothetical protein